MGVKKMENKGYNYIAKRVLSLAVKNNAWQYVTFMVIGAIINIEMFYFLRLAEETTSASYLVFSDQTVALMDALEPVVYVLVILLVFQVLKNIRSIIGHSVKRDIQSKFELSVLNKLAILPWEDYEDHEFQMKLETINRRGSTSFQRLAVETIEYIISTAMYVIIYVIVVMELSVLIGLIFLLATIMYFFIGWYFGRKLYHINRQTNRNYRRMRYLFRSGENKEVHQDQLVNRLYRFITKRYLNAIEDVYVNDIRGRTNIRIYILLPNLVFAAIATWLMWTVVGEMEAGLKDIGYFGMIITTIIHYRNTLTSFSIRMQWTERSFNVFRDYEDFITKSNDYPNSEKYLPDNFEIEFSNVSYTYIQAERKALDKFNIKLKSDETIAIVGVNGSGKTTFATLLQELSKRYEGRVLVNDKNINDEMGIIRNSTSTIFQDFVEYQVSIRDNIKLGDINRDISDEEIWEILDKVKLKEYVENLPDGIDTMLGQIMEGTELSKGQWQRLAVARLLANKHARIWVLDEPTAYLDPLAEIEMYQFIYSLKEDRTVIFISHRLGFAKRADRIVVFKDGAVTEQGSHEELLVHNGEYARMYNKQKAWYE